MDFELIGMEGLVGQHNEGQSADQNSKRNFNGSGPASSLEDDSSSRASKVARNGPDLGLPIQLSLLRSGDGGLGGSQHMLSFSSPSSEVSFLSSGKDAGGGGGGLKTAQGLPLSYYQHSPAPLYNRNAGYASGSMHGSFTGIRGPFTPAQWVELEHQALIYKYFTANVPVPATLLVPIRKALNPSGFSSGSFPSHSYGWGPIHLGYSGSTDPEPGRCRRTDGKKWRCSRDAVPDQKYCERHINRGRHRSRKPVEGQTGQAASGPTNPKVVPTSSSMSSSAKSGGGSSNDLAVAAHQLKNFQASASNLPTDTVVNRFQGSQGLCQMPTSKDLDFAIPKQHAQYEQSPQSEFGFVSSESLVNPWSKTSYINSKNYISFSGFNDQQSQEQQPACHLADRSTIPFPEELKSDWTQLSMAIPKLELSSSSSSNQEKNGISPLRLSRELYGVRDEVNGSSSKRENWVPNSWANPMGGPLGEVLNNAGQGLHLMTQALDGSPQLSSSPTGVLQKGASVSLSNSGSGSSPREEEKKMNQEGACLGDDDLVGSAYAASSSIPAV